MADIVDPSELENGNAIKKETSDEPILGSATPKAKASATPKKRKPAKKEENGVGDDDGTPSKKQKPAASKGIPDNLEALGPEDRMLMQMKADGKGWKEIGEAWFTMTGAKHTSLPTRYNRIKAAIARVKDEDLEALKEAMAEATERIEEEKKAAEKKRYAIVAEVMEGKGTEKYDSATLEKAWKRLQNENNGISA